MRSLQQRTGLLGLRGPYVGLNQLYPMQHRKLVCMRRQMAGVWSIWARGRHAFLFAASAF